MALPAVPIAEACTAQQWVRTGTRHPDWLSRFHSYILHPANDKIRSDAEESVSNYFLLAHDVAVYKSVNFQRLGSSSRVNEIKQSIS